MARYQELVGDILSDEVLNKYRDGFILAHVCNNERKWGAGFVIPLAKKFPNVEEAYHNQDMSLGSVKIVKVLGYAHYSFVANMIAQKGIRSANVSTPLRYYHLYTCLTKVFQKAMDSGVPVIAPMFGAGLAGGYWPAIQNLLQDFSTHYSVNVDIYKLA